MHRGVLKTENSRLLKDTIKKTLCLCDIQPTELEAVTADRTSTSFEDRQCQKQEKLYETSQNNTYSYYNNGLAHCARDYALPDWDCRAISTDSIIISSWNPYKYLVYNKTNSSFSCCGTPVTKNHQFNTPSPAYKTKSLWLP